MKNKVLILAVTASALLYGCADNSGSASGPWTAEIYPDAGATSKSTLLGEFSSYDECVEQAMKALGGEGVFNCSAG